MSRTNQFNTYGHRPTPRQIAAWSSSSDQRILVGEARDKFGSMGIISAMVVQNRSSVLGIQAWMLSCRVFGYGLEVALLNYVKSAALRLGHATLVGQFVGSPYNQPSRNVFSDNGFTWNGEAWISSPDTAIPNPSWLTVVADEDAMREISALRPSHISAD